MSKFFVDKSCIAGDFITLVDNNDIRHLTKVLRLKEGSLVDISDGVSTEYETVIEDVLEGEVVLKILKARPFEKEPELRITLFQGIPKAGKMELIIQKNVELGIFSITPVFMERTVVVEKGNFSKKLDRWQKVSDEAVKQCKRGIIPKINDQLYFKEMLTQLNEFDLILFPYENEANYSIKDCLRGLETKPCSVAVIIGPEGGFADAEVAKLDEIGAERVTLGKTILRTETAGMATVAMTMYELEL